MGPDAAINSSDVAGNLGVKLENPSRLRGTTTSRRLWILPSLLAGRQFLFFACVCCPYFFVGHHETYLFNCY